MKKNLRKSLLRKILYILIGFIAFIILLNYVIMPWYVSSPETKVPEVVGLQSQEAINLLEKEGFKPLISDTSYGLQVPPGAVFLQKPDAGKVVKEGRTIFLFVSGGQKVISVPLLKGKSILDAKFALERLGLKLGRVERIPSSQPEDMIFDQQYAERTLLKQGEIVGVTVSAGRGGGEIIVPDLIGKSLSEAKKILADSSLVIGKINYQTSSTLLPNTILDQYPSSGNTLNPGDAVDLFATKASNKNSPDEENN
ncbi:MAG: PASTA domain-containing protein [Ignavibacteriaceae bacterium]|nr:PASTA domain-containing protein [Ignavibacteriaceae bacterium]MCW8817952.1 PASTA domain-containing protein [Ignavibacteriaceae bacterium]